MKAVQLESERTVPWWHIFHRWTKWDLVDGIAIRRGVTFPIQGQQRECVFCGKIQLEKIRG